MENTSKLRELQLTEAKILHDFKMVCENNNLTYYLSYGTLLGATRHGGFIPWDDDIDVSMPYKDYLQFLEIASSEMGEDYFIQNSSTDDNFYNAYTKIRLNNTTLLDRYHTSYHIHHGVWIDIFPLIEIGNGLEWKIKKNIIRLSNYMQMENWIKSHYDEFKNTMGRGLIFLLIFYKIPLNVRKWLHKMLLGIVYKSKNKAYKTEVWAGITEMYPKEIYEGGPCFVEFEGEKYMVPSCYEKYLEIAYGDWRQLPPENERKGHGLDMIIDLNNDYKNYLEGCT